MFAQEPVSQQFASFKCNIFNSELHNISTQVVLTYLYFQWQEQYFALEFSSDNNCPTAPVFFLLLCNCGSREIAAVIKISPFFWDSKQYSEVLYRWPLHHLTCAGIYKCQKGMFPYYTTSMWSLTTLPHWFASKAVAMWRFSKASLIKTCFSPTGMGCLAKTVVTAMTRCMVVGVFRAGRGPDWEKQGFCVWARRLRTLF